MDARIETIEHRVCRQRTEEEDRAVDMCTVLRMLLKAGANEIRLDPKGTSQKFRDRILD